MTQYNSLNIKQSNSQLSKLKSAIENGTEVVLKLPSNMIGDSDDKISFPYELLLTNRQVSIIFISFAIKSSTDINLAKLKYLKYQEDFLVDYLVHY